MSYGMRVYRDNGALAFTSELPNYRFAFRTSAGSFTCGGDFPPLVFTRYKGSTGHVPVAAPLISGSAGAWSVNIRRTIGTVNLNSLVVNSFEGAGDSLVFTTEPITYSGYGLKIGDYSITTGSNPSLLVKKAVSLNLNGQSSTNPSFVDYSGGRGVDLGVPLGEWYGMCTDASYLTQTNIEGANPFTFINNSLSYKWQNEYFVSGLTYGFFFDGNVLTGPGAYLGARGTYVADNLGVLVIDSYMYI